MLRRILRFPVVEKCQNRVGHRGINTVQNRVVQLRCCGETVSAALGLTFLVDTEQIGGVVPQEIRGDTYRALHSRRQRHRLRLLDGFLFLRHILHCGNDLRQSAVFIQIQCEANLRRGPAGSVDLSLCKQILIIPRQCLQNHLLTSPLSGGGTVITPLTNSARKNIGVMFSGSR